MLDHIYGRINKMKTNHRRGFVARLDIDSRFTLNAILHNRHREKTLRFNHPQGVTKQQAIAEGIDELLEERREAEIEATKRDEEYERWDYKPFFREDGMGFIEKDFSLDNDLFGDDLSDGGDWEYYSMDQY